MRTRALAPARCQEFRHRIASIRSAAVLILALASTGLALIPCRAQPLESLVFPLSAALWDSLPPGDPAGGILDDEQEIEISLRKEGYLSERKLARTLAIADTALWRKEELGPDLVLPSGTRVARVHVWILPADGKPMTLGDNAQILSAAEANPFTL